MKKDILIEEIRKTRKRISRAYGHDSHRLAKHYQELEKHYAGRFLSDKKAKPSKSKAPKKSPRSG